ARECFALGDQFRREGSRCRRYDSSDGWLPRQYGKAYEPETSERNHSNEQLLEPFELLEHGVLRWLAMARVVIKLSWCDRSRELRLPKKSKSMRRVLRLALDGHRHRMRLLDGKVCRTICDIHPCEFERALAVFSAASVELRSMVGEGEQVSAKK